MAEKTIGLSREYIIHPGESIAEAISDRGMTQHEIFLKTN